MNRIMRLRLLEKLKHLLKFCTVLYKVWTTESYERVSWQKTKNVRIGQPYNEAA